jgi:hypothetical protein
LREKSGRTRSPSGTAILSWTKAPFFISTAIATRAFAWYRPAIWKEGEGLEGGSYRRYGRTRGGSGRQS